MSNNPNRGLSKDPQPRAAFRSRRTFLANAAAGAAAFTIVPSSVRGAEGRTPPSERIRVAIIGVGGQGTVNTRQLLTFDDVQVAAVADPNKFSDYREFYFGGVAGREPARQLIEKHYAARKPSGQYKGCAAYVDYREMLEQEKDIDAVLVATTDNHHASASMAAMRKRKHVYCEKPLTLTVHEAQQVAQACKKYGVATQTGNHGQASEEHRLTCEWIADGAIGDVREVHVWTDRPVGYWPQGIDRPKETPPVPEGLDWDRWIGPAPFRPYHPLYHPFRFRGWVDFAAGTLGDAGAHSLFTVFQALKLGYPTSIEATTTPFNRDSYPLASVVYFKFPARGSLPPVTLTWYDGGLQAPRPEELEAGRRKDTNSVLYVGDKGKMLDSRLIPEAKMKAYQRPPKSLPRSPGHHREWVNACKGQGATGASFDLTGPMTEVLALGNIALRFPSTVLHWDAEKRQFANVAEANQYLHRPYREGWIL